MNMSNVMDKLPYTYLLLFYCFTSVCIYGRDQDAFPSCEVTLMVQRGTTLKAAPRQRLTAKCPVHNCGESIIITWCKLLSNKCEPVNPTENVEIIQNGKHDKDKLISFLNFKRISIHDDGLYRCRLMGYKSGYISHSINISVSASHRDIQTADKSKDEPPGVASDANMSWLPYFAICFSIALLVSTLTLFTYLCPYGRARILTDSHTKGQEMPTHSIPNLPKGSDSPTLFLQTHFSTLNHIYSPNTAERPPPAPRTAGTLQPEANTAEESHLSDHAGYAVINHHRSVTLVRDQHAATRQTQKAEYAAIKVS